MISQETIDRAIFEFLQKNNHVDLVDFLGKND